MPQILIKSLTFLMLLCSLNSFGETYLTSSDYDVAVGDTVTLSFDAMGPSPDYLNDYYDLYLTRPGSSSVRIKHQIPVTANVTTTFTLDTLGTNVFELRICYPSIDWCEGGWGPGRIEIVVSTTPKPEVNISFPSGIYEGDGHVLEVTSTDATSCTFKYASNGTPVPIGTYLKETIAYSGAASVVQTASCTGPGGTTSVDHAFTVYPKAPQADPVITSLLNGDVISGQTKLYWNSNNTDRCELKSGSTTANVATVAYGYNVSVPYGGRTFTLSCFQGSKSVSKELYVPRPSTSNYPCIRFCDLELNYSNNILGKVQAKFIGSNNVQNAFVFEHKVSLMQLGINLLAPGLSFNTPDLNADGFPDLIVYQPKLKLAHVLLNDKGSFDTIAATAKRVNDWASIKAIYVDEKGNVQLEVMPEMVITKN
ncbi:MAG: hypothetical protein HRT35_34770 [Algicola sp.]|nr:hypothetical protein [Algicola sp.]